MARIGNKLIAICSAAIGIIYAAGYIVTESTAADTVQNEIAMAQPAPSIKPSTQPIQTQQADPTIPETTSITVTAEPTESIQSPEPDHTTLKPVPIIEQSATTAPLPTNEPKTPTPMTAKPQKLEPTPSLTPTPTLAATPTPSPQPTPIVQNQKYKDGIYTGSGTNRFGTVEVTVTIEKGEIASVDITSSRTRYPQKYIDPLPAEVVDAQDYNVDTVSGATRSSEDFINAVKEALMQAEGNN
jgi:uncharacterized protein with FMN-binding domain